MNQSKNEQQLITIKLKSLQTQALSQLKPSEVVSWFLKFGLCNQLPNVPRIDQFQVLSQLVSQQQSTLHSLFKDQQIVSDLLDQCQELYDMAFVIEQHAKIVGIWTNGFLIHKLFKRFGEFCDLNKEMEELLYLQGINLQVSLTQSSNKEPAPTFITPLFHRQRKQAAKVYQFVIKPLFEKKDLKPYYMRLIGLTGWLVLMDGSPLLINDLSKKLNSFVLYHKHNQSLQMISCCTMLFDWLSVHFPRDTNINLSYFASLLTKFRQSSVRLDTFFEMWIENRVSFINTISFDILLRNLTQMGFGTFVLQILAKLWSNMKKNKCYQVLLKIFSGYIRKQYLSLWMQKGEELQLYLKLAKFFMVGFCNRQRFQGQQIDQLTNNLCRHLILRKINFMSCYKQIIQFYALYENRFTYLSQTSKRFLHQTKQKFNATIQTPSLHQIFDQLTIREINYDDGDVQYWQKGKISYRYRGLQNMGNTCYINSFIQCLFMTKRFRALIHQLTKDGVLPSSNIKTYALSTLFQQLLKKQIKQQNAFFPDVFRMMLPTPFNQTFQQQDTGEFGRVYLQQLVKQMDKQNGKRLQKLLFQRMQRTLMCQKCNNQKKSIENVFDLIVPVDRSDTELYLSRLLQRYFGPQKFSGQNKVYCNKCGSKQDAVSELVPDKMSEVVVFTLNLFDYVGQGIKILTPLTFEFTLNFDVILSGKDLGVYQLYAFIVHIGASLGGGHYICYIRNLQQNPTIWFCLDDGHVTQRQIGRVQQFDFAQHQTPYMLFYSKKPSSNLSMSKTLSKTYE